MKRLSADINTTREVSKCSIEISSFFIAIQRVFSLHKSVHFCRRIWLILHNVSFVTRELDLRQTRRHRRKGGKEGWKTNLLFFPRSNFYPRISNINLDILRFGQALLYKFWPHDFLHFAELRTYSRLTLHSVQLVLQWSCTGNIDRLVIISSAPPNKFEDNFLNFLSMNFN
jgi:hypothetical protein